MNERKPKNCFTLRNNQRQLPSEGAGARTLDLRIKSPLLYQLSYALGDQKMVITEGLKHFKTILKGQKITVHTNHLNLTFATTEFTSDRMLRQRLLLEEYGVDIKYIKGEKNVVADALSRLPIEDGDVTEADEVMLYRRIHEFDSCQD